jgi:uncharacterized membrane protein YphA (DoxX/SURF4 family)
MGVKSGGFDSGILTVDPGRDRFSIERAVHVYIVALATQIVPDHFFQSQGTLRLPVATITEKDVVPDLPDMEDRSAHGAAWAWLSTAARLVLAGVWAWAGFAKIADPDAAARAVRAHKLLPEALVKVFARGLPFVEIALALLLFAGLATRVASLVAAGLLAMFIFSISSAWARGLQIDCGCFVGGGTAHADAGKYLSEVARDLGLMVVAAWLAWRPTSRLALDSN